MRTKTIAIGEISNQMKPDVFLTMLTFYVGNLHYNSNYYLVKKAVKEAILLNTVPIVNQVVITKTSKPVFVLCVGTHISLTNTSVTVFIVQTGYEILDYTKTMNPYKISTGGWLESSFCRL